MKKSTLLFVIFNVFWGLVEIYKMIEYIYAVNITQNTLGAKEFLGITLITMVIVLPVNIAQLILKDNHFLKSKVYLASLLFVVLSYIAGFGIIIFYR